MWSCRRVFTCFWGLCKRLSLAVLFMFLQDCGWNQKVDPTVQPFEEAPIYTAQELLDSEAFYSGFWPTKSWWEIFEDPCLDACIKTALKNNPDLLVAKSRVEEAKNVALREGDPRWFQISAEGEVQLSHLAKKGLYRSLNPDIPPNAVEIDLNGIFSYNVDIWGQNYERYMAAVNLFQSSQAKQSFVEVDISTRVAETYFVYQSLLAQIGELNFWIASQKEIIELSFSLLQHRIIDKIQYEIELQALEQLNKDLESLSTAAAIQKHLLSVLMGQGPLDALMVSESFCPPEQKLVIPSTLSLGLLKRRPDLAADIFYLNSLQREIKIARTLFYPNINLVPGGGIQNINGGNIIPQSLQAFFLPSFSLPIFTGFRLTGNLGAKIKSYEAGVHQYNANVLKACEEVADAISNVQGIVLEINFQKGLVEQEKIKLDLTQKLFVNNIISKIQLNIEKNLYYQRWITLYNLYRLRYQYHVQLIRSLGGGYLEGEANG